MPIDLPINLYIEVSHANNIKNMIKSTQITNTEFFAFTAALVFQLLSHKILFRYTKDNRNC